MTRLITNNDIAATINSELPLNSLNLPATNTKKHFTPVPAAWYSMFTTKYGTPDLPLITILAEICFWYTPKKVFKSGKAVYIKRFDADFWQASYKYFRDKLGLNHQAVRRTMVKLEEYGLVKRHLRMVTTSSGRKLANVLFLQLNQDFHSKYFLSNNKTQNTSKKDEVKKDDKDDDSDNKPGPSIQTKASKEGGSVQTISDITNNRIIYNNSKYRSTESNFLKDEKEMKKEDKKPTQPKEITSSRKKQQLLEFYPLEQKDCDELQMQSGRCFSLNAMNEILKDIARKLKDRAFWTKKCFMKYFSKILEFEMRDAHQCSNSNFRIKANLSEEEIATREQENYLTRLETSSDTSKITRLKQKLLGKLEANRAYEILQNLKSVWVRGGSCYAELTNICQLSSYEEEQILCSARAIYETYDIQTGSGIEISRLIVKQRLEESARGGGELQGSSSSLLPKNAWGRVRSSLISYFGSEGRALDKSWFSKLELVDEKKDGRIRVKSESSFVAKWINQNYSEIIERFVKKESYNGVEIC